MITQYSQTLTLAVQDNGERVAAKGEYKGKIRDEFCIYKDGRFMAGGDFPVPTFELKDVTRWKSLKGADLPVSAKELLND